MKVDDILKNASELLDVANDIRDGYREGVNFSNHIDDAINYYNSEEHEIDRQKADSYYRKAGILMIIFTILWIIMVSVTVTLCVTGNDVILRFLHM